METRSLHSTDLSKTEEIKPPASPDLLKKPKKPWRYQLFHFHRSAESRLISSVLDRSPHPRKQPQQCHDDVMYAEVQLGMGRTLWRSRQVAPSTIPADGYVDLIASGDQVLLCGPQTRWIAAGASDSTGPLGIRLAPGTASTLAQVDLPAVRDSIVDAEDVLSRSAIPLCEALLRARDSSDPAAGLSPLASSDAPESWVTQIRQHAIAGASACESRHRHVMVGTHAAQAYARLFRLWLRSPEADRAGAAHTGSLPAVRLRRRRQRSSGTPAKRI